MEFFGERELRPADQPADALDRARAEGWLATGKTWFVPVAYPLVVANLTGNPATSATPARASATSRYCRARCSWLAG